MTLSLLAPTAALSFCLLAAGCGLTGRPTQAHDPQVGMGSRASGAAMRQQLDDGYRESLVRLFDAAPASIDLVTHAVAILIVPRLISDGLLAPGQHGEGQLRVDGAVHGYYRAVVRADAEIDGRATSLVFLFMTEAALDRFLAGQGWSAGIDVAVASMTLDASGAMDPHAARSDTIAFCLSQRALRTGVTLEGATVTRID